jgi:hypothetical protein
MMSAAVKEMTRVWIGVALAASFTACRGPTAPPPDRRPPLGYVLATAGLITDGIWKSTPALVDINGDGFLDLAALPRLGEGARVWLGNGKGTWAEASRGLEMPVSCGGGVALGDVNNDRRLDLVVGDHCEGVFVYLGDGQGHWNASTKKALNPRVSQARPREDEEDDSFIGAEDVALGDVNKDGSLDLVAAASNEGGFSVYLGGGSRNTWKEVTVYDGLPSAQDPEPGDEERAGWANRVLLTDLDGDGHLDVVASYYAGPRVWRGDGTGKWQSFSSGLARPSTGGLYRGLAVGDVNKDGRVDLVVANTSGGPEAYLQRSDGTWERSPSTALSSLAGGADSVALGDLDGDSHLDLVIGGRRTRGGEGGLFVFLGNGKAEWAEVEQTRLPAEGYPFIWGIALGDVNGDGKLDLAVATGANAGARPARPNRGEPIQPSRTSEGRPQLQVWVNDGERGSSAP